MGKSSNAATTCNQEAVAKQPKASSHHVPVSALKRRKENRMLFRDLDKSFTAMHVDPVVVVAAPKTTTTTGNAMELVKTVKDSEALRQKRRLQRERRRRRKRKLRQQQQQPITSAPHNCPRRRY